MEGHAYLGELAAAIFYLVVGARLLHLASRTGELPERLLGALFLITGASYVAYELAVVIGRESLWTPLNFAGRVIYLPAPVILAVFTRRVFRAESAWAAWLVRGCAALLVAGVTGSVLRGDWEGFSISSPWFWLEWTGYTIPYAWAGAESLIHYGQARRRMRLGLCAPLVCNRFLLWGLFGTASVIVSLMNLFQYAAYERESVFNATWDSLTGAGEILSIALIWLVFFPPASYRQWVTGMATRANAAGGS
jgi:hypothetical protein